MHVYTTVAQDAFRNPFLQIRYFCQIRYFKRNVERRENPWTSTTDPDHACMMATVRVADFGRAAAGGEVL